MEILRGCCESRPVVSTDKPYDFRNRPNERRVIQEFESIVHTGTLEYKVKLIDRDVMLWKVIIAIEEPLVQNEVVLSLDISMHLYPYEPPQCLLASTLHGFGCKGTAIRLECLLGAWTEDWKMSQVLEAVVRMVEVYAEYRVPLASFQFFTTAGLAGTSGGVVGDVDAGVLHLNRWDLSDPPLLLYLPFQAPDAGTFMQDVVSLPYIDSCGVKLSEFRVRVTDTVRNLRELLLLAGLSKYFRVHTLTTTSLPTSPEQPLNDLVTQGAWLSELPVSPRVCTLAQERNRYLFLDKLTTYREKDKLVYVGVGNGGMQTLDPMALSHQYYPPFFQELVQRLCGPSVQAHTWLVDSSFAVGGGDGAGGIDGGGPEIKELFASDVKKRGGYFSVDVIGTVFNLYAPLYRYLERVLSRGGAVFLCMYYGTHFPHDVAALYADLKIKYGGNFQAIAGGWCSLYKAPATPWIEWMALRKMKSDIVFALCDDRQPPTEKAAMDAMECISTLLRDIEAPTHARKLHWDGNKAKLPRLVKAVAVLGALSYDLVNQNGVLTLRGYLHKDRSVWEQLRIQLPKPAAVPCADASVVSSLEHATVGRPTSFMIVIKDTYGAFVSHGGLDVKAQVRTPLTTCYSPEVVDNRDGTYTATYTPDIVGVYQVSAFLDGKLLANCPASHEAHIGPLDPMSCVVKGDGLERAVCKREASFTIQSMDCLGNKRTKGGDRFSAELIKGAEKVSVTVMDHRSGDYTAVYTPIRPGHYELYLLCGSVAIRGSPFSVTVESVFNSEGSKLSPIKCAVADCPLIVTLTTMDTLGEQVYFPSAVVTASVSAPDNTVLPVVINDRHNGLYDLVFTPVTTGTHSLSATVNGVSVGSTAGTSFVVSEGEAMAHLCTASGLGLVRANALLPNRFTIQAKDARGNNKLCGGSPFRVIIGAEGSSECSVRVVDNFDGTHAVTFSGPSKGGPHLVSVTLDGTHIHGSPFTTVVQSVPNPRRCELDVPQTATLGDVLHLRLITRDDDGNLIVLGGYSVEATLTAPSSPAATRLQVEDCLNGSYTFSVPLTETRVNKLAVKVAGIPLKLSPFEIKVRGGGAEPGHCTVEGAGVIGGYTGKRVHFNIVSRDCNGDVMVDPRTKFVAQLTKGPTRNVDVFVTDLRNGSYQVSYTAPAVGHYHMVITNDVGEALAVSPLETWIIPDSEEDLIQKAFKRYDVSGDGSISEVEFTLLLDDVGAKTTFKTKLELYREIDADGAGGITYDEFEVFYIKYWHNIPTRVVVPAHSDDYEALQWTEEDEEMTRSAFMKYDQDGSDSITLNEFEWVLDDLGIVVCKRDREELFNTIDSALEKGDGGISYDEFENWWFTFNGRKTAAEMKSVLADKAEKPQWNAALEASLKASFDKYDSSGDGQISFLEFGQLLEDMGCANLTTSHLLGLFERIDANGSGDICFDEFRAWWVVFQTTRKV